MVRKRVFATISVALLVVLPQSPRSNEKPCDFQSDILALSNYVLKNRAALPRFKSLRYGAISAYLALRYQKLSDRQAEQMLMPLVQARVSRADELMFTWAINSYGVDAAIAIIGPKSADILLKQAFGASVVRAAIVKEGISVLGYQWRAVPDDQRFRAEIRVPMALLDKFDTYKSELGRQAEAAGFFEIAAGLAATQQDPKAWTEFAARTQDKAALQRAQSFWYWAPAVMGNPALKREKVEANGELGRQQVHHTFIAAAMMPERDFLLTYLNQSGKFEQTGKVANTIITVASDKSGTPWTMDRAWITAYLELLAVSADTDFVEKQLRSIPFGGLRHYDGSVRDALDWMIAADALRSYVLKTSAFKTKPDLVSAGLQDWNTWQKAADMIRSGNDLGPMQQSPETQAITAELLFAAGRQHQLASFVTTIKPDDQTVGLAEDFANRLDRTCYGYLNFPAESITYPDTPMFRFD